MASAKPQKSTNEEHKFSQKISEVTAWGSKVLGHKQQEQQATAKHCTTSQCSAPKDTKSSTTIQKKGHNNTISIEGMKDGACTETKKKQKEHTTAVHKEAKHSTCIELKKKEKPHKTIAQTKDSKKPQPVGAEMKTKEKKEHHAKSNMLSKKEHKDEPANHWFSGMGDHLKEKIMVMKKSKDGKHKESSSSDNDSVDESGGMTKKGKRHSQGTKTSSK